MKSRIIHLFSLIVAFLIAGLAQATEFDDWVLARPPANLPLGVSDMSPVVQGGQTRQFAPDGAFMRKDGSNATLPSSLGLTTVYAKQYGVLANRVNATDGAITAASTAFTSTSTTFTAADVGKIIIVVGAGTAGVAHVTTISAFVGAHAVTLAAAAATTVGPTAAFEYATNDAVAVQAAITAATAAYPNGARVVLPAGGYIINPAIGQITLASNITLDGENAVNMRCASVANNPTASLNACIKGIALTNITIKDMTIRGMADIVHTFSATLASPIFTNSSTPVTISGINMSYSRSYSIGVNAANRAFIKDNIISYSKSNSISCGECNEAVITGNIIDHSSDSAIATSTGDTLPNPSSGRSVVISNNSITESIGIQVSGARSITISDNTMVRMLGQAIYVSRFTSFGSGDTATSSVNITGNTVLDVINHAPGSPLVTSYDAYIVIGGGQRQAGGGASVPGYPVVTTGVVADLYGTDSTGNFFANDTDDTGIASPGSIGWNISDNMFIRTLPAVTTYSQWGYGSGLWLGAKTTGIEYNGPIAEADLQLPCIVVDFPIRLSSIRNNICATTGDTGVYLRATSPAIGAYDGLKIEGNTFYDFGDAGILVNAGSTTSSQITIRNNDFNGDPRFRSANRGTGGTWLANTAPFGIVSGTMAGLDINGNRYRNLANPYAFTAGPAFRTGSDETIYGIPSTVGFSTSNIGVGAVSGQSGTTSMFKLVCEDGDPRNATFGQILYPVGSVSSAMPTTGCWLRGTFVGIIAPTAANGQTLIGWTRLVTGTNNVLGTDWQPVYTSNSTSAATNQVEANPTGTSSATGVMMAMGGALTPASTGKVLVIISGDISSTAIGSGGRVLGKYGTGTAPVNGAAETGTNCGPRQTFVASTTAERSGFSTQCVATGLTVGTAYWFDFSLLATTSGTATAENVSLSVVELR